MVAIILYAGKQEAVDTILVALQVVPEPLRGFALVLVEVCAYAGEANQFFPLKKLQST